MRRGLPLATLPVGLLLAATPARSSAPDPTVPGTAETDGSEPRPPTSAGAALVQAGAAYEQGDLAELVEAARLVAEGAFPQATHDERAEALRFLGIGLFLGGRPEGAERAFERLLALRPAAHLDPATTRPELVAFFERIRRKHRRLFAWNFLPPAGQIQNGDRGRAWLIGGAYVVGLAGALSSYAWLRANEKEGHTFPGEENIARAMKAGHFASYGLVAAAYAAGVLDAVLRFDGTEEPEPRATLSLFPGGAAVRLSF